MFSRRCLKQLLIEIWSLLSSKFSGKLTNLNIFISLIFCYCLRVLMLFFVQKENLNLDPCGLLCFALAPAVFTSAFFSFPLLPSVSLSFTLLSFASHFPSLSTSHRSATSPHFLSWLPLCCSLTQFPALDQAFCWPFPAAKLLNGLFVCCSCCCYYGPWPNCSGSGLVLWVSPA